MPTVSVIIPTYNRVSMVREAVQSVLEQTYTDYEIIVVDDGSTDNTKGVVTGLSERIVYVYQPNHGRSNARNHGMSMAKGKYIAFLDSDDLFLPTKLEKQVEGIEKRPDVLLSHTSYQWINTINKYTEEVKSGRFSGYVYPKIIQRCPIATPTVMLRREALGEKIKFEEAISNGEDVILWVRFAHKSPILGIDEALTQVRIHGNNAAIDSQSQISGVMNVLEYTVRRETDITPRQRRNLLTDGYLKIGFYYLLKHEVSRCLKFLSLALRTSPLYMIYWIPKTFFSELFTKRWLRRSAKLTKNSNSQRE
jgi:glycosyltransferase involved in cell wall biosynthesis